MNKGVSQSCSWQGRTPHCQERATHRDSWLSVSFLSPICTNSVDHCWMLPPIILYCRVQVATGAYLGDSTISQVVYQVNIYARNSSSISRFSVSVIHNPREAVSFSKTSAYKNNTSGNYFHYYCWLLSTILFLQSSVNNQELFRMKHDHVPTHVLVPACLVNGASC